MKRARQIPEAWLAAFALVAACIRLPAPVRPGAPADELGPGGGRFCDSACVVQTFEQLAPIYRPSGEEQELRQRLIELASEANRGRWPPSGPGLEILGPDPVGNFVIRVPATGRFMGQRLPPVALQAHMDMVLAASAVPAGSDLRAHFRKNPVSLEEKDGQLQSAGRVTSIGADNTVGCALMIRYALDPTIEHPPIELVFTVHEEVGLKGAREYDTAALPLRARVMINLDAFDSGTLVYGSQGSVRRSLTGLLETRLVKAGKLIKVTVSGLRGGHSGADIHQHRLNAVIALAALAKALLADASLGVMSAVAGDLAGLNKIPTNLELTLVGPASLKLPALRASVEAALRQEVSAHPGEAANQEMTIAVAEAPLPVAPTSALTPAAAARLIEVVLATELSTPPMNGVVTRKVGYPNAVNTSSNLGLLDLKAGGSTTVGFMIRSFSREELGQTMGRLVGHLRRSFAQPAAARVEEISGYEPWLEDPDSWLMRLGLELQVKGTLPFTKVGVQAIGMEPSYFQLKFPDIEIVAMGAGITDAHSAREAVSIQSIRDLTTTIDAFLARLAMAGPLRKAAGSR
jgi:dipeptidase D